MDWRIILYCLCSAAGFVMIIGGIWLLAKQKIYLNPETGAIVQVDLGPLGKFKTNIPSLGLFLIGGFLLVLPPYLAKFLPELESPSLEVTGSVNSNAHPVVIYAVIRSQAMQQDGSFTIPMPQHMNAAYDPKVLYVAANAQGVFDDDVQLKLQKGGQIQLSPKKLENANANQQLPQIANPVKPTPIEYLR